jgi:hypothetical protein
MKKDYYIAVNEKCQDLVNYFETNSTCISLINEVDFAKTTYGKFVMHIQNHRGELMYEKLYLIEDVDESIMEFAYQFALNDVVFVIENSVVHLKNLFNLEQCLDKLISSEKSVIAISEELKKTYQIFEAFKNPEYNELVGNVHFASSMIRNSQQHLYEPMSDLAHLFTSNFLVFNAED